MQYVPELTWIQTYEGGGNYIDDVNASLTDTEGNLIMRPGLKFKVAGSFIDRVDFVSLMLALFCGTAAFRENNRN